MQVTSWRGITLVVCLLGAALPAAGAKEDSEEVDHISLAALMIRDGYPDRADSILSQVDREAEDLDEPRFYTLRGLTNLQLGRNERAVEDLTTALEKGKTDPLVTIYLAQAYFQAENFLGTLAALDASGELGESMPSVFVIRAQSHWRLGEYGEGWQTLDSGQALYPDFYELERLRVFFAIDRGLFITAAELGRAYLARTDGKVEDYLAIGTALDRSGSPNEALSFLEFALLRYPNDRGVLAALAKLYRDRDQVRAAASLLERAAIRGETRFLVDAAELYRTAGAPYTALLLNSRIGDRAARLRQRLAILLDLGRFPMVTAMERDLRRAGILADDNVRYAVAYCHFKNGDFARAEKVLARLTDPELFRQAADLRRAMEDCRTERWKC